jgi:pimeloyl-ACP methyl ester carboxylesterase
LVALIQISPGFPRLFAGDEKPAQAGGEEKSVSAAEDKAANTKENASRLNLAMKTGGGTQLWTDHLYRDGYRIQQNVLTGHWRLLDAKDVRRAWGTRTSCQSALDDLHPRTDVTESPKHVVVLLHGLMRTRHSMKPLEAKLKEEGYPHVIRFSYASTRSSIGNHAAALRELLEQLPSDTQLSFVGHSMGCIVVRHLIGDLQREGDPRRLLARCRSMVMLGPPNQGAAIARRLAPTGLYGIVTGQGGLELGPKWDDFAQHLASPPFPFAIIAGDLSQKRLQNPLVDSSGDYIVSVEEARLDGAESFETVPVLHSVLMNDAAVMDFTIEFIKSH